ncbi:MAG TPA: hypothetical protein PKB06_06835 [Actinotalea sp.]|nr:hypothetical protein [Actinotalea sp.]
MGVQEELAELYRQARQVPGASVTWTDVSTHWLTARVGIDFGGGYVELIEDGGQLCVLAGGSPARPLEDPFLQMGGRDLSRTLTFALGMAYQMGLESHG